MVRVYFKDKLSDTTWTKEVTKAFLAKMYFEFRVIGWIRNMPVIEV